MEIGERVPRLAALASLAGLTLATGLAAGQPAQGAPVHPIAKAMAAAKAPPGAPGLLSSVAAVPHSSNAWAVGAVGTGVDNYKYFELHRHHGHWTRVKSANLNGRYGVEAAIAAPSAKSVWIGGSRQEKHPGIDDYPDIWRLAGKRFVPAKIPKMFACACAVSEISASSPTNAWAIGTIYPAANDTPSSLHWNGKTWSIVPLAFSEISTSGPHNAWALADTSLYHWDGKTWTADGTVPAAVHQIGGLATTSSTHVYVSGTGENASTGKEIPEIFRYNGTTWSKAKLAKNVPHNTQLTAIAMHGKSGWVVGNHETAAFNHFVVILHTAGGKWSVQHGPKGANFGLTQVSATSAKHAIAVGNYYSELDMTSRTFADVYNGRSWRSVSTKP